VGDVEPAVEVIGLVQKGAGQQVLAGQFEGFALGVARTDGDAPGAFDILTEARDAQAALFDVLGSLAANDLRIDEDELLGSVLARGGIDDGDTPSDADLRSAISL
jgi:hypothetical protein